MTEPTWEIEAPSLAITIRWGDVALHTAHLDPPRSFFLGGVGADCVLPESAVGAGRVPLILAERGAIYLVLHPSMDPDGAIAAPGRSARTVADLARAGMAEASLAVPGGFLIELAPGTTAALAIDGFTITIALETKAARAVAGHFHVSRRMVPFQLGSAALHVALLGAALALAGPPVDPAETTAEQIQYLQQVFQAVAAREEAELGEFADDEPPMSTPRGAYRHAGSVELLMSTQLYADYVRSVELDPRGGATRDDGGTGTYAEARRRLQRSELPAPASVLPEELINSVSYSYPEPSRDTDAPFAVQLHAAPSPYEAGHHLLRVGIQGRRRFASERTHGRRDVLAREVAIRVDFNPDVVRSSRRIGDDDFNALAPRPRSDRLYENEVDGGYRFTVVYDVVLASTVASPVTVRIQHQTPFRYDEPRESFFVMSPWAIAPSLDASPPSFRLAVAVTGFAEILHESRYAEEWRLADVERILGASADADAPKQELATLVHTARSLLDERRTTRWSGRVADASLMGF